MAIGRPIGDLASKFNSVYNVTQDLSGWSQTTIQVVAPMSGAIVVYGSNDNGDDSHYNPANAKNFVPILATNVATGTTTGTLNAAGLYTVPVNAQFMRLQGTPAAAGTNVYKLLLFNQKVD